MIQSVSVMICCPMLRTMCCRLLVTLCILHLASSDYWSERSRLITLEASEAIGAHLTLSPKEERVNNVLMRYKLNELDYGFAHPEHYLPAMHFFKSKRRIEQSKIFTFIKLLPKGASLHSHDSALVSEEYVFNLTYRENLYGCFENNRLRLHFFGNNTDKSCDWKLVKTLREEDVNFDKILKSEISIVVKNPARAYPDINDVWKKFYSTFATVVPVLYYIDVFQDYFYQALLELYQDNVMYLEFRSTLTSIYDLSGNVYSPIETVKLYFETVARFKEDHPDFHGARLIYAPSRHIDNITLHQHIATALQIQELFPDFLAGFDLVGQEDLGEPLEAFIPQLLELSKNMKLFFHAGETNWNGMSTDFNLVDAVLLNTTRIGHGYDLLKHHEVLKMVKDRGIAIEVSPISNQVLKLVDDMRNHPASVLINRGFNVVICCDDPGFWGAKALSYDWYMAFMGMASRESDLRFLKQLALNSILYSAMKPEEKEGALESWKQRWNDFLEKAV